MDETRTYTAFAGDQTIAAGDLRATVSGVKARIEGGETRLVLVFEDQTGAQIDFNMQGTPEDVIERLARHPWFIPAEPQAEPAVPAHAGPGRPKLGVVCREVSLLPRHWSWLEQQRGGASAALRTLVDEARKRGQGGERARLAWEAAGRFMWVMAGDLPCFEEASRALYGKDTDRLADLIRDWPVDVRAHVARLAGEAVRLERVSSTSVAPGEPVAQ